MGKGGVLNGLVVGWQDVEPILLACIAAKINVILRGKHGTSKTIFAKLVAQALGGTYRHYDATKDDMVSVAGIPNPEDLKKGVLSFSKHDRAIWDADYISIDELTRAPRESQNMWLEILEEKTCTGFPLKYRMALATMNPATYNATYRVDEALLDRFAALVDIPEVINDRVDPQDIFDIVKMNINGKRGKRSPEDIAKLGQAITAIAEYYHDFASSPDIVDAVCGYAQVFGEQLVQADKTTYISPRRFIHLANCLMASAAYYKFAQTHGGVTLTDGIFVAGAKMAATHVITSPLNISPTIVKTCHEKAASFLKNVSGNQADKLLIEINKEKHIAKKVDVFGKHLDTINTWSSAEVGSVFDSITAIITEQAKKVVEIAQTKTADAAFNRNELASSKQVGAAIDTMKQICEDLLQNKTSSIAMRVAAKNNLGAIIAQRFRIMQGLAAFISNKNDNNNEIYTYSQIMANQSTTNNIWDGNLVNNSLADTISTILKPA
jgi:MoxR-like ATPase